MIGEVSAAEMQDLRQHLSECADCREQYREFTQFLLPQLSISSDNDTSFETGYSTTDRTRLRKEFLAHAQKNGMTFSQEAIRGTANITAPAPVAPVHARAPWYAYRYRWALAATVAMLLFAGGYGAHLALVHRELASIHSTGSQPPAPLPVSTDHDTGTADAALAQLRAANDADTKTIAVLQQELTGTIADLEAAQHSLATYEAGQSILQDQLNQKNSQLAVLQSQTQGDAQNANDLRIQVTELQQRINDGQATLAANELRIRDLNDQLATQTSSLGREREMLSVGRDVRDLMGARNLHIIDVHDANGAGKDRPSFGRVFYTEGKSLIFYAFDLDDKKVVNANYSFEAWGERLGQPGSVKSLGVLYVDDKAQRRWSLKVNDPQQLSEIDSVFVTLEPHKGEGDKPHGPKILYAFLGGEPNHP
jgi:hypothetical protein